MRHRLTITRLRIAPEAVCRLDQLDLSFTDLDLILGFARKTSGPIRTVYTFDPERLPADARGQVSHLVGCAAIVIAGEVVDIIQEANGSEPLADSESGDGTASRTDTPAETNKD